MSRGGTDRVSHIAAMRVLNRPESTVAVEGRSDGTLILSEDLLATCNRRRVLERRSSDVARPRAETIEPDAPGAGGTG